MVARVYKSAHADTLAVTPPFSRSTALRPIHDIYFTIGTRNAVNIRLHVFADVS